MGISKGAYLKQITSNLKMRSISIGEKMEGSSPPSVFIGAWNYPKVYVGPMISPDYGDTSVLDTPESWIPGNKSQEDIIKFRLDLVRGKHRVDIKNFDNKLVGKLQEISLARNSVDSEALFKHKPKGFSFDGEHQPFGPSASIDRFDIGNVKWEHKLEKVFYDTDHKAASAAFELYKEGVLFSQIQKAFSTGSMGIGRNRKLVPTRWSITALDSTLADSLYKEVKHYEILERYLLYQFTSLNNYYAVLLTPTPWQYEWMEAFIQVMGREELIFADSEQLRPKKEYSSVGGCYYSCKFAILEKLKYMRRQAGAIVLREAYPGYVPLGVFNVRENVRNALAQPPIEFDSLKSAMNHISTKLRLPIKRFVEESRLLQDLMKHRQTTITELLR
jgi:hypothetical protein